MTVATGLDWLRQLLFTAVITAGPSVLAVSLLGLIVAIVQAATQVNDQAVAFGPKALALVVSLVVGGPFMLGELADFTVAVFSAMGHVGS